MNFQVQLNRLGNPACLLERIWHFKHIPKANISPGSQRCGCRAHLDGIRLQKEVQVHVLFHEGTAHDVELGTSNGASVQASWKPWWNLPGFGSRSPLSAFSSTHEVGPAQPCTGDVNKLRTQVRCTEGADEPGQTQLVASTRPGGLLSWLEQPGWASTAASLPSLAAQVLLCLQESSIVQLTPTVRKECFSLPVCFPSLSLAPTLLV